MEQRVFSRLMPLLRALAAPLVANPVFFIVAVLSFVPSTIYRLISFHDNLVISALLLVGILGMASFAVWMIWKGFTKVSNKYVRTAIYVLVILGFLYLSVYRPYEGLVLLLLWAYLFTTLVHLARCKWIKVALYVLIFAFFVFNVFIQANFATTVSPTIITLISETNKRESGDFFQQFLFTDFSIKSYVLSAVLAIMIVWIEYHNRHISKTLQRHLPNLAAVMVAFILVEGVREVALIWMKLMKCQTPDEVVIWKMSCPHAVTPTDLVHSFYSIHLGAENTRTALEATQQTIHEQVGCTFNDSLNIVMVIGESYIKYHTPLYGYPLMTTPHLCAEADSGRLFVFDDMVSPYNLTSEVIKNLFCCNSLSHGEKWFNMPVFPAIFKRAGYNVSMWDNQRDFYKTEHFSFALNSFLFNDQLMQVSYDQTNKRSSRYDEEFVDDYIQNHHDQSERQLAIFHIMGQHFKYSKRYPPAEENNHFTADSIQQKAPYLNGWRKTVIAEYDNATYYNDFVVNKIIDIYRDKPTVVVYFSDHGDEVYDARDFQGRNQDGALDPITVKYEFEVPFMVWVSDSYKEAHPEVVDCLRNAVHQPGMIDNTCQMLFHIGGIQTRFYHEDRDILSPDYQPVPRLLKGLFPYEKYKK